MKYRILLAILACSAIQVSAETADTLAESQHEAQAVIDKANRLQQQASVTGQEKAQAGASALQERERANAELEAARVVGEGDRQSLAGGGSKLTAEYLNRVQAAEKQVGEAKKKLNQPD